MNPAVPAVTVAIAFCWSDAASNIAHAAARPPTTVTLVRADVRRTTNGNKSIAPNRNRAELNVNGVSPISCVAILCATNPAPQSTAHTRRNPSATGTEMRTAVPRVSE